MCDSSSVVKVSPDELLLCHLLLNGDVFDRSHQLRMAFFIEFPEAVGRQVAVAGIVLVFDFCVQVVRLLVKVFALACLMLLVPAVGPDPIGSFLLDDDQSIIRLGVSFPEEGLFRFL